ncbi:MAG: hypothetical protein RL477_1809 [Pseudomonadota bacterium]|jgi:gamma-glutamylcyclotransferase (GGCT)/AIG2-like uncharacterized protein YtfP
MARLFFYGTLRDADVLARVIGRRHAARLRARRALAPGWRAVYAAGKRFPVLVRAAGANAPGVVVDGVGPGALACLDAFEASYRRARIGVVAGGRMIAAGVYLPTPALRASPRVFALGAWTRLYKRNFLKRIGRTG